VPQQAWVRGTTIMLLCPRAASTPASRPDRPRHRWRLRSVKVSNDGSENQVACHLRERVTGCVQPPPYLAMQRDPGRFSDALAKGVEYRLVSKVNKS
jgi:hypothetical protein